MNFPAALEYRNLLATWRESFLLSSSIDLLSWDQETMLPAKAGELRAEQLALLSKLHHQRLTHAPMEHWLRECEADAQLQRDPVRAANVRCARSDYERAVRLPEQLVGELAYVQGCAQQQWAASRAGDDFASFAPWLERVVRLQRSKAACLQQPGQTLWEALAEQHEPGMREADLRLLFASLREQLNQLRQRLCLGKAPDQQLLLAEFDEARQESFVRVVLAAMGFDPALGRLDRSAHPFCIRTGSDVRLTTRFARHNVLDALGSTMHEGGHGLYEQGLPLRSLGEPWCQAASYGLHESQSRLWENHVGRSAAFWQWCWPIAKQHLGAAWAGSTPEQAFRTANRSAPSPIRTEADESTYDLHIMVRFELELALLSGALPVAELPTAWRACYREMLGIEVADDRNGCLQDVHWACGLFGYFPTYTLGNLYAAQFSAAAQRNLGNLEPMFAAGNFAPLREWLRRFVHDQGRLHGPQELCRRATGQELSSQPLLTYLTDKLTQVYQL